MAAGVGRGGHLGGRQRRRRRPPLRLRARDAPLPVGRAAHRPSEELLARRRGGPLLAPPRPPGAAPHGLRRVRPSRGERGHQDRAPPAGVNRRLHRRVPAPVPPVGDLDRLDARAGHERPGVLPLDPVDLPQALRAGPRLPQGGRGQVVSQGRHRAGQRAGDRRPLRALRHPRRGAPARAVVLPHHRVRRPAARGHARHLLAAPRRDDAGELDRPLRGRGGGVPLRGARDRLPGLHHPPGHALRRHLLRDGPRAPGRVPPQRLRRGARLREPGSDRVGRGARRREQGEDRRGAGPDRHQPGQRRADPDVRGRLRADGVRHRRDHGRARARPARLRVRRALRPGDPARGGPRRRRGRSRRRGLRLPFRRRGRWSTRAPSADGRPRRRSARSPNGSRAAGSAGAR